MDIMPKWVDIIIVPLLSLFLAAFLSALLIIAIGESPIAALNLMIEGTLLRSAGWGYMLYYTTNFIFTGLAVSVAFHAALFNIGGEGQAMIGGLGVALGDIAFKHLPVGGTNDFLAFVAAHPGFEGVTRCFALGREGVDRRQLQALSLWAAEFLTGGRSGNSQLLEQHVETVDRHPPRFGAVAQECGGSSTHFLKCHVGGCQ